MQFRITRDPYEFGIRLYTRATVDIQPGLTILVGANGAGKSTFLHAIKDACEKQGIPVFSHDNHKNSPSQQAGAAMFFGSNNAMGWLSSLVMASEGESIAYSIANNIAGKLGNFIGVQNRAAKDIFILMDAVDSGSSIDNIEILKRDLFGTIVDDCKKAGQNVYIIVSANTYAMAAGEQCFDVQHGKYTTFATYDEYRAFILKSREIRDKAGEQKNTEDDSTRKTAKDRYWSTERAKPRKGSREKAKDGSKNIELHIPEKLLDTNGDVLKVYYDDVEGSMEVYTQGGVR